MNLALQCVGLAREKMDDQAEATMKKMNSMKEIREKGSEDPGGNFINNIALLFKYDGLYSHM